MGFFSMINGFTILDFYDSIRPFLQENLIALVKGDESQKKIGNCLFNQSEIDLDKSFLLLDFSWITRFCLES